MPQVEITEVKATFVAIAQLEEERDGYVKEAKRCKEDIKALLLTLRRKVTSNQEEMPLSVHRGREKG